MPHFEEYKNSRNKAQFYKSLRDSMLDINKSGFDYDPDQLMEHLEDKYLPEFDDIAEDNAAFAERTKYYFTDSKVGKAKELRYKKIHDDADNSVERYSDKYSYRWAWKRKYYAKGAEKAFKKMRNAMFRYRNDYAAGSTVNVYTRYLHREEIMKLRMAAMEEAAKTKAQSAKHGNYLVARGKLSCNLILKDQLEHLLKGENLTERERSKLRSKLRSVEKDIKSAASEVAKNVPKAHEIWQVENRLDEESIKANLSLYQSQNPGCDLDDAKLMANLNKYQTQQFSNKWPKKTVLKDQNNACISKAEQENEEWNRNLDLKLADNLSIADARKIELDAIKRFNAIKIPKAAILKGDGARKYIMGNLREYYDLTKRALPYYRAQTGQNTFVGEYIAQHPKFRAKLAYLEEVNAYIDFKLRRDHNIEFDSVMASFRFESDENYKYKKNERGKVIRIRKFGFDNRGRDMTTAKYNELFSAYRTYKVVPEDAQDVPVNEVQEVNQAPVVNAPANEVHDNNAPVNAVHEENVPVQDEDVAAPVNVIQEGNVPLPNEDIAAPVNVIQEGNVPLPNEDVAAHVDVIQEEDVHNENAEHEVHVDNVPANEIDGVNLDEENEDAPAPLALGNAEEINEGINQVANMVNRKKTLTGSTWSKRTIRTGSMWSRKKTRTGST